MIRPGGSQPRQHPPLRPRAPNAHHFVDATDMINPSTRAQRTLTTKNHKDIARLKKPASNNKQQTTMKIITRLLIAALALTCSACAAPPPVPPSPPSPSSPPSTPSTLSTLSVPRVPSSIPSTPSIPSTSEVSPLPTTLGARGPSPSSTPTAPSGSESTPSIPPTWITYTHPAGHLIAHLPPTARITSEAAHLLSLTLAGGSGVILIVIAGPTGPPGNQTAIEEFAGRVLHEQPALDTIRVIATGALPDPAIQANYIELLRTDYITEASYHQLYLSMPVASTPNAHIEALILHPRQIPAQDRAEFLQIAASLRLPPP